MSHYPSTPLGVSLCLTLCIAVCIPTAAVSAAAEPPPAVGTPPVLRHQHDESHIGCGVRVTPGVAAAGEAVFVVVEVAQPLTHAHHTYGKRRPVNNAEVEAVLVGPEATGPSKTPWVAARRGRKLRDAGTYGLTFTPPEKGVYGLHIRAAAPSIGELSYSVPLAVQVWPLPDGVTIPAYPNRPPPAVAGDLTHGRTLCAQHCRTDVPGAFPAGQPPTFLASHVAEALSDQALLEKMVGGKLATLSEQQRGDLLYHLRSLHAGVDQFFPESAAYLARSFTINEYGRQRLRDSAGLSVSDDEARGTVFVAFKGESSPRTDRLHPTLVPYEDRVARDALEGEDKLGYLVFFDMGADELAVALGREPEYPIVSIAARARDGKSVVALNGDLKGFVGLGRFNDPRSLSRGPGSLRHKLTRIYLTAAELATMYYADEREFSAFDAELEGELTE